MSHHFVCMHVFFVFSLFSGLFSFVDFPSVLWYCWLGFLTCKNRLPYNLYCVGGDVKHCTIQSHNMILLFIVDCFLLLLDVDRGNDYWWLDVQQVIRLFDAFTPDASTLEFNEMWVYHQLYHYCVWIYCVDDIMIPANSVNAWFLNAKLLYLLMKFARLCICEHKTSWYLRADCKNTAQISTYLSVTQLNGDLIGWFWHAAFERTRLDSTGFVFLQWFLHWVYLNQLDK